MDIANPFGHRLRCHILHLLLQSLWLVVHKCLRIPIRGCPWPHLQLYWSHGVCLPIEQIDVRLRGLDCLHTQDDTAFTERSALPDRGTLQAGRMFTLRGCIFIIVFVLLLLYLLLLPRSFINEESVESMVNQLVFVCHALTGIKTTLFTELGLWRRSSIAWRRASGASGTGCRGPGSGAAWIEVHTTDPVVQWLARGARRGMRGIWRRSSLFRKPQARSRLGEVINIVPPIGTARRG
ncbi:hypothetical protein F5882DRAFT_22823 [Hyaloscypha sp. PMI_1271]|nr:hypothetical protein F5882DRAFT_22823 [Hyaloscypha sp. PMI_1271]